MVCKVHSMSVNSSMMQGVMHIEPIVSRNSISIIMNLIILIMYWMYGVIQKACVYVYNFKIILSIFDAKKITEIVERTLCLHNRSFRNIVLSLSVNIYL